MQVSDNFGPIYQSVVLDGSGGGAVSFQATGSNIRLTNIYFNVGIVSPNTQIVNQAVCRIYKGQIAPGNVVLNSNSGSTGGNANGNVDLFDGETCYVVWSGGDGGATATATFTGGKIPFGSIEPSSLNAQEPFAAGDGSIIFPALKSPNYVAGVSGWKLDRNGDAELNDLIARGEVEVLNGSGGYVHIWNTTSGDAVVDLMPDSPLSTETPARIFAYNVNALPATQGLLRVEAPAMDQIRSTAQIAMFGQSFDGTYPSQIDIQDSFLNDLIVTIRGDVEITGKFSRPNCTVYFGTPTINTGGASATALTPLAVLDTYGMVSGNDITIPKSGMWDIGVVLQFSAQATAVGFRQCHIFKNGVEQIHERINVSANFNNDTPAVSTTYPLDCLGGDVISFRAYQTAGVSLTLTNASRGWLNLREG